MSDIPLAPVERILRRAGSERVSNEAVEELRDAVEELGEEVAIDADRLAAHADRKTVKREDVEAAVMV